MNSEGLRTFVAIARAGGFAAAAERLHRSQPAISRRIALLEEEVGAPLFERVRAGVRLSTAGRVLLPGAERALAALEECEAAVRQIAGEVGGPVRLVSVGTLAGAPLVPALKAFSAQFPKVDVRLATATSAQVSESVAEAEADIGLRYGTARDPGLENLSLGAERMVVVAAAGSCFADAACDLGSLAAARWLAFPGADASAGPSNIVAQFAMRGQAEIDWLPVYSLTAQKRLVEAGLGLALLPVSAVAEEGTRGSVIALDVTDLDAANPVCLVTRRSGYLSLAATALRRVLADVDWNGG